MTQIGWIDFSSEHRDKVRTVLDLLSVPGVIDELGIGIIRDTFSDRMFPGISTIQTRPKYFCLIALLYKRYRDEERSKRRPRSLHRFLEEEERRIRIQLVERHGEERGLGIIGGSFGTRSDRGVIRRPSSVYWVGMQTFGIISPPYLSSAEFGRRISDDGHLLHALLEESRDERGDDLDAGDEHHQLHIRTPDVGAGYWDDLMIELTPEEGEFLSVQIRTHQLDSVLGQILADGDRVDQVEHLPSSATFVDFANLPLVDDLVINGSDELRRTVQHARDFWSIMEGAHIRYNCMLQERGLGSEELRDQVEAAWQDWQERIAHFPADWDSGFMWSLVAKRGSNLRGRTKQFIDGWIEESRNGAQDIARCNRLVTDQERHNKRKRSRLRPGHEEPINDWVGFRGLDYRFGQVRQLVSDIRAAEHMGGES